MTINDASSTLRRYRCVLTPEAPITAVTSIIVEARDEEEATNLAAAALHLLPHHISFTYPEKG